MCPRDMFGNDLTKADSFGNARESAVHDVLYGAASRDQIPDGPRPPDHPFVWHHFAHWCGTCQTTEKTCHLWETTNGCEFWFCSVECAILSGLAFSDHVNILKEGNRS